MSKPNTAGCTEWSCMYHGGDNRFKAAHFEGCPVRESSLAVFLIVDEVEAGRHEPCSCWPVEEGPLFDDEAEDSNVERFLEESKGLDEPPGFDMQYDAWDEPRDVREGWE